MGPMETHHQPPGWPRPPGQDLGTAVLKGHLMDLGIYLNIWSSMRNRKCKWETTGVPQTSWFTSIFLSGAQSRTLWFWGLQRKSNILELAEPPVYLFLHPKSIALLTHSYKNTLSHQCLSILNWACKDCQEFPDFLGSRSMKQQSLVTINSIVYCWVHNSLAKPVLVSWNSWQLWGWADTPLCTGRQPKAWIISVILSDCVHFR